jgi:rSAM/selenodomain-associated transferase 1
MTLVERGRELTVGVMARAPIPGQCKTRLFHRLDPVAAAALYEAMLLDTLDAMATISGTRLVVLAAPENDGFATLRGLAPREWDVVAQRGRDLGERLANGFVDLHEAGQPVVLVSSDSPTIPIEVLRSALPRFGGSRRALMGPAEDGGYYLIGLTVLELGILQGITWSTSLVAQQTRVRMRQLGLPWEELPMSYDVDTPSDLDRLRAELAESPHLAPRCARFLGAVR